MSDSEDQETSFNDSTDADIDSDLDSSDSEHVSPDSEQVSPDSEHVSPHSEHVSPDSSMIFTQCVPQIQVTKSYDNKDKDSNEDKGISTRSIETQCTLLKRSVSTRDVAVQTNDENYALHCQKKAAIYVGKESESVDNGYLNIEPRKSIRLGLSKKWKLGYKFNK